VTGVILKRIGRILSAVPDGHFLARVDFVPRLGAKLFTSGGKLLGMVDDVLGPVSSPFILVRPLTGGSLEGSPVYLQDKGASQRRSELG
jgi:rRNA processing protein Gar1